MVQKETYTSIYNIDNVQSLIDVTLGRHAHIELSKTFEDQWTAKEDLLMIAIFSS